MAGRMQAEQWVAGYQQQVLQQAFMDCAGQALATVGQIFGGDPGGSACSGQIEAEGVSMAQIDEQGWGRGVAEGLHGVLIILPGLIGGMRRVIGGMRRDRGGLVPSIGRQRE